MNNFRKTIPLLLVLAFFNCFNNAEAQLISKYENLQGFTKTEDITILDDYSQVDGLIKIGDAYSKARGVTMFSAMNSLNSRAKKKLLEEATVRGASHVLITKRLPDDGIGLTSFFLGRLFSYQAIFYRDSKNILSVEQVKSIVQENKFSTTQMMTTNRNAFGADHANAVSKNIMTVDSNSEVTTKNGRVYISVKSMKPTGISSTNTYEVIGAGNNHLLLSKEIKEDQKFRAFLLKKN